MPNLRCGLLALMAVMMTAGCNAHCPTTMMNAGENSFHDGFYAILQGHTHQLQISALRSLHAELVAKYEKLHCQVHKTGSTGGFCIQPGIISPDYYVWDAPVCEALSNLFQDSCVYDFGAGVGNYGRCLTKNGTADSIRWAGFDGAVGVEEASGEST